MTLDNVKIVRRNNFIAVYDDDVCIHSGTRTVDHNFAERVYLIMIGDHHYTPKEFKGEITFTQEN